MKREAGALADHPEMIEGARLYHTSRFWDAHEAWERVWIAERDEERRRFVQGLIQLAAALHKLLVMGNAGSARAIARRAREKIAGLPDSFEGFAVEALRGQVDACIAEMDRAADAASFDRAAVPRIARLDAD
jgi:predicted metal-dependent hydrolase